jgi:hypothetical protein
MSILRKLLAFQDTWRQGLQPRHPNFRVLIVKRSRERDETLCGGLSLSCWRRLGPLPFQGSGEPWPRGHLGERVGKRREAVRLACAEQPSEIAPILWPEVSKGLR